jgi:hypothetical protein
LKGRVGWEAGKGKGDEELTKERGEGEGDRYSRI